MTRAMTFGVESANVSANGYEVQVLRDALSDYRRTWMGLIRDCEEGRRPNMDPKGAQMILDDTEELMRRLSESSQY
jgi:hypothetical protein